MVSICCWRYTEGGHIILSFSDTTFSTLKPLSNFVADNILKLILLNLLFLFREIKDVFVVGDNGIQCKFFRIWTKWYGLGYVPFPQVPSYSVFLWQYLTPLQLYLYSTTMSSHSFWWDFDFNCIVIGKISTDETLLHTIVKLYVHNNMIIKFTRA